MKKFNFIFSKVATLVALFVMAACGPDAPVGPDPEPNPDPTPDPTPGVVASMTAEVVEVGVSTAIIKLTTENIKSYAYVAEPKDVEISADIIIATGIAGECADGETVVSLEHLNPSTNYFVTFVGITTDDELYEQPVKATLTTEGFTDEFTVFDQELSSISVHLNYPTDKVQPENVLKWGICSFPLYYTNQLIKGFTDAEMLNRNEHTYPSCVLRESTTWVLNERNSYIGDPNSEESTTLYDPLVPGEPCYFMLGEFAYDNISNHWGWGEGYFAALFDFDNFFADYYKTYTFPEQDKYWFGYYRKEFIQTKSPARMSATPEVEMNLTPMGGKVTFKPSSNIALYCIGVMDNGTLMEVMPLLNNKSEYLQWYITSYHAFMSGLAFTFSGETTINLEDLYYMSRKTNYTLYVVALSDEFGSKQSFKKYSFTLPEPTKPAPTATVEGMVNPDGEQQSDRVWFRLKCTSGNAVAAKYIANYEREWKALQNNYIKQGFSEQEALDMIISSNGAALSAEEIEQLNSANGLEVSFFSRPDANNICGISVMNDEGTWSSAIGQMRSAKEKDAERVESPLFEALQGDWVASTRIVYNHYHFCKQPDDPNHRGDHDNCANPDGSDESNYLVYSEIPFTSPVHIGPVGYEATLPEYVYDLFFQGSSLKTREEVDAVYDQFKTSVDDFNANVRGQNRILCQGFELEYDEDKYTCPLPEHTVSSSKDDVIGAGFASPYELFTADASVYSAYNYESPIFDFGPKWYLEIAKDGTVTAPFNTQYFSPMAQWFQNVYQFIAASASAYMPYRSNEAGEFINGHFPVTISEDMNTITINPFSHTHSVQNDDGSVTTVTENFYPQIAREYNGTTYQFYSRIVAPIVLTRKGTAPAQQAAATTVVLPKKLSEIQSLYEVKPAKVVKSRTALPLDENIERKMVKINIIDKDEYKANCIKIADVRNGRN